MILSIVSGTYNRLGSLIRMVESVRANCPRGMSYEIVIVDGGSQDNTQDWCKRQSDIRLIEHGELRGAIRAFCDGARAAQGEYVLLANDDVSFKPYSIIAALSHLERTPTCAAVAFADNRTSLVHGNGREYRVEGMGATTADGQKVMVVYAQVGLFRRELAETAGWWGDRDPVMGAANTYGGDNYLSSRLWESGYTVDAVPQAVVEDHIERDNLRQRNANDGGFDSSCYYRRYPTVQLPSTLNSAPTTDRLRILHLPVYEQWFPGKDNREAGLTEALADYGLAIEFDYLNTPDFDFVECIRAWQPDLLVSQIQGPGRITPYMLASARNAAPNMVICNWNGDVHEIGLTSPLLLELLRYIDLQLVVNAKVLPFYRDKGVRAAYWQIGYKDPVNPLPEVPQWEVLLQANCYNKTRDALVSALRSLRHADARKVKFGLYGRCKGATGNTHYDFTTQRALYASATITVGDTYPGAYAYVSNRVFQALAAGAFLLQQHSEGLQQFTGLEAGVHFAEWSNLTDLKEKAMYWLAPERAAERAKIAAQGRDFVRANFSYPAQVRKLFQDLLPMIAEGEHVTA